MNDARYHFLEVKSRTLRCSILFALKVLRIPPSLSLSSRGTRQSLVAVLSSDHFKTPPLVLAAIFSHYKLPTTIIFRHTMYEYIYNRKKFACNL